MAPRVPAEILENIRPGSAYGNNGGYGCLLMETVKDRPYGAIFDQAIHITIGIYNSGRYFEHWDPQHLAPVDKVNIFSGVCT